MYRDRFVYRFRMVDRSRGWMIHWGGFVHRYRVVRSRDV